MCITQSNYSLTETIADAAIITVHASQRRCATKTAPGLEAAGPAERIAEGADGAVAPSWTHDRGGGFLQAIEESGLTLTQVKALVALDPSKAARARSRHLAEELGITPPTATRAIDALVERDLVSRSEDTEDRRVRRIAITEAGQRLVGDLARRRTAGLEAFADGLSASPAAQAARRARGPARERGLCHRPRGRPKERSK